MTASRTSKHRATAPVPATDRSLPAGAHRASRVPEAAIVAVAGVSLLVLLVVMLTRG